MKAGDDIDPSADFLVVGAGIAAASVGYFLAPHGRVVLLEREAQPGYHSTGRSVALFFDSYGTPQVRALTQASRAFYERPPPGFADAPLLAPRGALIVAAPGEPGALDALDAHWDVLRSLATTRDRAQRLGRAAALALVPVLRPERVAEAVLEPDAADIDVHVLHHGFLRGIHRQGGEIVCSADVTALRREGGRWHAFLGGSERMSVSALVVVDAAGAWCDAVARLAGVAPIGLVPKRRSAFVFAPPALSPQSEAARWPLFAGVDHSWYVKPDAGMLIGSPANEDDAEPHDVQPEEIDIANAVDRIEANTTLSIPRIVRRWAGLRSFVADGDLVGGFDAAAPGFFWLAGQGGYGIQTAPAMGEACAAIIRGRALPAHVADCGVTAAMLSPLRPTLAAPAKS